MIYLARWSLVERWCSFDAQAATARFRQLVSAGLGPVTEIPAAS